MQKNISIITIGDELLIGQVVDTNSAWMAQLLSAKGMQVVRRVAVGDTEASILAAINEEKKHADIVLITGGLGPTSDDLTKPVLNKYFGGKLVLHEEVLTHITTLFEQILKRPITQRNIEQAMLPDVCTVIPNKIGTAAGMLFEQDEKIFISMPGVPQEMKLMMQHEVVPLLLEKFSFQAIVHETIVTYGVAESSAADMLIDFENRLPENIKLAYLPNYGLLRLRLTGTGANGSQLQDAVSNLKHELKNLLAEYCVAESDLKMQEILGELLLQRKETLCTAESCTGGYIAHLITSIPGSSQWYEGSGISYSYDAKERLFGVSHHAITTHGAVSEEVAIAMAEGALELLSSTYSVAVSGIMGPGGGMEGKPVGTVWMAVAKKGKTITQKLHFRFDRQKNIELTAMNALNMLRSFILAEDMHKS